MPKIRANAVDDYDDEMDAPVMGTRQMDQRSVMRETRDADVRPAIGHNDPPSDYVWRRPTALDAPPPRPGYTQRWVAYQRRNEKDMLNWSNKTREGWQPRDPASLPEEFRYLRGATEGLGGMIVVGGLVLCEMPEQMLASKRRYIREAVKAQERSVSVETDNASREGARHGLSPVVREERITSSRGRVPSTSLAD